MSPKPRMKRVEIVSAAEDTVLPFSVPSDGVALQTSLFLNDVLPRLAPVPTAVTRHPYWTVTVSPSISAIPEAAQVRLVFVYATVGLMVARVSEGAAC